jgi:butyryl-CoA:acetate CoA-transferase
MKRTYLEEYKRKLVSAEEAMGRIKSNDRIWYGSFNGKPIECDKALAARKEELFNVIIETAGSVPPVPQVAAVDPSHRHFTYHSWYFTGLDRMLCDRGLTFYSTINYHECRTVVEELKPADAGIFQVAPMDEHGFFNFGPNASHHYSVCQGASLVVVEVNQTMPRCLGGFGEGIHISAVDCVVEGGNTPVFELPRFTDFSAEDNRIADFILEEMHDRVCLQLGIGNLPAAIGKKIVDSDLRDLGIHSEMFVDAYMDLMTSGKVTGKYKGMQRGKASYTFSMATQECYDFMNDNPLLASCPGDYTNDPKVISMNDNVMSINNIIEIDLYSQISAESTGQRQISGTGGQVDFVQGAFGSKGGKSFLCLHSTAKDKEGKLQSRIVPTLGPATIVTSPRSLVHYVVTENGIAMLKGRSTWERAEALIEIAHPAFQDELIREAEHLHIWRHSNRLSE